MDVIFRAYMGGNATTAETAKGHQSANMADSAHPVEIAGVPASAGILELAELANSAAHITNFYWAGSPQKKSKRWDPNPIANFLDAASGIFRLLRSQKEEPEL